MHVSQTVKIKCEKKTILYVIKKQTYYQPITTSTNQILSIDRTVFHRLCYVTYWQFAVGKCMLCVYVMGIGVDFIYRGGCSQHGQYEYIYSSSKTPGV